MSKIHIGKNGPAPCHASKGKCPLGGESGEENHFDNMKAAEAAFAKQQGGNVKTINKNSSNGSQKDYKKFFSEPFVMDNLNELQKAHRNTRGLLGFATAEETPQGLVLVPKDFSKVVSDPNFNEKYTKYVHDMKDYEKLNRLNERNSKKLSELSFEKALPQDIQDKMPKVWRISSAITPEDAARIEEVANSNPEWKKEYAPIAEIAKKHKENLEKFQELSKELVNNSRNNEMKAYASIYNNKLEKFASGEKNLVAMGGNLSQKDLNKALKTINSGDQMPALQISKVSSMTPGSAYSLALDVHEQNKNGGNLMRDINTFGGSKEYKNISNEFNITPKAKGWSRIAGASTNEKELREIYSNPEAKRVADRIAANRGSAINHTTAEMDKYLVKRLIDEKGVDGAMKYLNDGFDKKEALKSSSIALNLDDVMNELNFKSIK